MKRGFSLIELLLVIALIVITAALSFPFLITFQRQAIINEESFKAANQIRRARGLAKNSAHDDGWSFRIEGGDMYVFKGADFINRDQEFDEVVVLSPEVTASGAVEYNFDKLTGSTADVGSLTLTLDTSSYDISVNSKGSVSY